MRRLDVARSAGLWVAGIAFAACAHASPPAGAPPKDAKQAFAQSDVVFAGKVERTCTDEYGYASGADVRVQRTWKGSERLSPLMRVDGKGGPTYPARLFRSGEVYLFYLSASGPGKAWRADSFLDRVLPIAQAADDLKFLSSRTPR